MQQKELPARYVGKWVSAHGQVLTIRKIPLFGSVVNYYPKKGRPRVMLHWELKSGVLMVSLSWLVWLETMLLLHYEVAADSGEQLLVPELECGPESKWWEKGFGYEWLLPLAPFRRDAA